MNILFLLIPITLVISIIGLGAFFLSIKSNQYEDLDGSANRILTDED